MGNDDAALAVLSEQNQLLLYNYFKQLFAQVTNPPIGRHPRRTGYPGGSKPSARAESCFAETITGLSVAGSVKIHSPPVLTNNELARKSADVDLPRACKTPLPYPFYIRRTRGAHGLKAGIGRVCAPQVDPKPLPSGCYTYIILSDRDIDPRNLRRHSQPVLATAAVHHHTHPQTARAPSVGLVVGVRRTPGSASLCRC